MDNKQPLEKENMLAQPTQIGLFPSYLTKSMNHTDPSQNLLNLYPVGLHHLPNLSFYLGASPFTFSIKIKHWASHVVLGKFNHQTWQLASELDLEENKHHHQSPLPLPPRTTTSSLNQSVPICASIINLWANL